MNTPAETHTGSSTESDSTKDRSSTLVRYRADLLERKRRGVITDEQSVLLDRYTTEVTALMARGSLTIRRLQWHSDRQMLLRLAPLEPVHPFADPTDGTEIASRTGPARHCYVLENSMLAGRPLNIVWVALFKSLPTGMDDVIGPDALYDDPTEATTAVFYSIWNVEKGLAGIEGGSSLLGLVMDDLRDRYPMIGTYTTLSPVPGLRSWLTTVEPDLAGRLDRSNIVEHTENRSVPGDDDQLAGADEDLETMLSRCCIRYLLTIDDRNLPIDDVARFHMRNGARLWRLVPRADRSPRGWQRSWGMMVNYRYAPEDLDENRADLREGDPVIGSRLNVLINGD